MFIRNCFENIFVIGLLLASSSVTAVQEQDENDVAVAISMVAVSARGDYEYKGQVFSRIE